MISADAVLFGHQDDVAYGVKWKAEKGRSDVKQVCGSYPELYGWYVEMPGHIIIMLRTLVIRR
jgi:hypothetical protein